MKKYAFLATLEKEIGHLENHQDILMYYRELIDEAISNGEEEKEVIKRLGTPQEIYHNLMHDDEFIVKLKEKRNVNLTTVISKTYNIITCIIYGIIVFTFGVVAFSLTMSGLGVIFNSTMVIIITGSINTGIILYALSQVLIAIGLILVSMALWMYIFKQANRDLKKVQIKFANKSANKGA